MTESLLFIPLLFPFVLMGVFTTWIAIFEIISIKMKIFKNHMVSKKQLLQQSRAFALQLNSVVFTYFALNLWYSFVRNCSLWSQSGTIDMICLGICAILIIIEVNFRIQRWYFSIAHVLIWSYFSLILCYKAYLQYTNSF